MNHRFTMLARFARRFLAEQQGATASEYAVILAVMIAVVATAAAMFGAHFAHTASSVSVGLPSGADDSAGAASPFRTHASQSAP